MAEKVRISLDEDGEPHLDLKPLLRFGGWGGCALITVAIAVFASRTDAGGQRADAALASITGSQPPQALRAAGAEMLARAEAEREARRTVDALRVLAADRDRLSQRIALLERNLDDLTGSIKRKAEAPPLRAETPPAAAPEAPPPTAAAPPPPPAAPPAPAAAALATAGAAPTRVATVTVTSRSEETPPRPVLALPETVTPKELPPPVAVASASARPAPPPAMMAMIQSYASSTATPEPETPPPAGADGAAARPEFAVDLGASTTVGGLRVLWEKTRARQLKHLGNLQPLISVRDGARPGTTELRLVAGPIASAAAAARLCAALVVSGVPCRPAMFDGQRLAQR